MQQNITGAVDEVTTTMPPALLVSATYNSQKKSVVLKFYEPNSKKILLWTDNTGHKPYCYSKLDPEELKFLSDRKDVLELKKTEKIDLLKDRTINVTKIIVADPLAIGGTQTDKSIRNIIETWESDIKYYENYLYDYSLIVGKYYTITNGKLEEYSYKIPDEVQLALKGLLYDKVTNMGIIDSKEFQNHISDWANLLNQPIPKIRRVSFDIEVESETGRIPDAKIADKKITAVGFSGSDGLKQVFVLQKKDKQPGKSELDSDIKISFYDEDKEKDMIRDTFKILTDYPFVITYNGDDFDMPYIYNRAERLGIDSKEIPLIMMRDSATLKHGVHLDLYRTFSNRSFQIYAFSHKYNDFSLNSVSEGLLNESKIDYDGELDDLSLYELANYCYNDAKLTQNLTSFNNDLLMDLLVVITRIARMPIDDISRMGVSQWIRSLFYFEHRKHNFLIPQRQELDQKSPSISTEAIIKDKKYRGGLVVEPTAGIHFDVSVMDFASLYPSIIKVRNLSYETVRCIHDECKKNTIPGTNHWVCIRKNGLTAVLIGSLRDLRVNYYKSLAKNPSFDENQKQLYTVVSQALKVILNASYGVMGAEIFPLYCLPVAEATTAVGRYTILETIEKCKSVGIEVLYGDTDSLFLKGPTKDQIQTVVSWAKEQFGVDLDLDKEYLYVVLSTRKKNYLGVQKDGKVDVKGLTGKKSHTPPFIRTLFYEILEILSKVKTTQEFTESKEKISDMIAQYAKKLKAKQIPLSDLAFNVMISKAPSEYVKTVPQHIRAAKLLEQIREIKKGDIISYVKIINKPGVKPVELARPDEIDSAKYMEFMESTFDQILSSMDLDFATLIGAPKQTGLDQFFWN
ncbi:MAG: DNA-directed DNA polymerase I [Thaumarchaeota archaeon]|nr:DNA-directed DNA polymerase I [Nitrososphaerota archaeon]MBI3639161.1 DNA-directed DNA polymerase I [Nitrososphaerota archaeon]